MNTIVISRLVGSEAGIIAQRLADTLGYDLIDKSILQGTLQQYGLTQFGKLYTSPPNLWDVANSKNLQIVSMLNDTMKALAHRGRTVILARGGYVTLSKYADVLNVRLQAPYSVRVNRVMAREDHMGRREAKEFVAADDKARMKFVKRFYNQKWADATDFDLVLNTDVIPTQTAEEWIIKAAQMLESKGLEAKAPSAKQVEIDPLLLDAIDQALNRRV